MPLLVDDAFVTNARIMGISKAPHLIFRAMENRGYCSVRIPQGMPSLSRNAYIGAIQTTMREEGFGVTHLIRYSRTLGGEDKCFFELNKREDKKWVLKKI